MAAIVYQVFHKCLEKKVNKYNHSKDLTTQKEQREKNCENTAYTRFSFIKRVQKLRHEVWHKKSKNKKQKTENFKKLK